VSDGATSGFPTPRLGDAATAILALSSTSVPSRKARVSTLTAVGTERRSRDGRITDEGGPR
jgi:hypothetical protein